MAHGNDESLRLSNTRHPILYEVNARVLLTDLSSTEGKRVTLGAIPDSVLDEWAEMGIDAVWMMGVWTCGPLGIAIAREHPDLALVYESVLPGYTAGDVGGSPYAVQAYTVPASLGGETGLKRLRRRLAKRGVALVLDYVCNHTARDHEWVEDHPEYYIHGREGEERERPDSYFRADTRHGTVALAYGRDPSFPGWTDTAQLNSRHRGAREAMIETLGRIASRCDGARCDMAMLVLNSVFERTWGDHAALGGETLATGEFWKEAIETVRKKHPSFLFIAEAYWNMEWDLQQLGFNYTYDKTLYDRLLREGAGSVRDHLRAEMDYQMHSVRFMENHDEPRAATAMPSEGWQYAAATVIATVPGMVMFHEGQFEGRKIRLPVQLCRRPPEESAPRTLAFYERLLGVVAGNVFRQGGWRLLMPRPAWNENYTWQNVLAFWWEEAKEGNRLVIVNYAPLTGQCYIDLPLELLPGRLIAFRDLMGEASYNREKHGLTSKGLYFDLPAYGIHIFRITSR